MKLKDGGTVCLDWYDSGDKDPQKPTVLFLPGLTGDSQTAYVKTFVNEARTTLNARDYYECYCSTNVL